MSEVPVGLVDRLRHYFATYKQAPDAAGRAAEIAAVYGAKEARLVIARSGKDYRARFGWADR